MSENSVLPTQLNVEAGDPERSFSRTLSFGRLARIATSFPAFLALLLAAKVYWTCRSNMTDPDFWWHLLNGGYIVQNFHLPSSDLMSYTVYGQPWIDHEWLSEVAYYFAYHAAGLQGVFTLFTLLLVVLVIAVFALCRQRASDPLAAAITSIFGGLLAMVGFAPRAQHFGWLCFTAVFAILLRYQRTRQAPLWIVPVIFAVWINFHGTWPFGFIALGIFIAGGLIPNDFGRLEAYPWTRAQLKQLGITAAFSLAALFVNPVGYKLVCYPFDMVFEQKVNVGNVEEWVSVDFNDWRGKLVFFVLAAVLYLALTGRRKWLISDAAITMFVLYCGLTHIRFLLLAGIVLPVVLAPQIGKISSYDPRRERRGLNTALSCATIAICISAFPSQHMLESELQRYFPVRATRYLRDHPQRGRMFNSYGWGGYLTWMLPEVQTFIDSRADIFDHTGVMQDYVNVTQLEHSLELLDRYKVDYVIYPPSAVTYLLSKTSNWEQIYADKQAEIYRRKGS